MSLEPRSRVLVVEDNVMNMRLMEQILTAAGYQTLQSANGDDLVEQVVAETPIAVLMDIQLPKVSGVDLLRQLRADPRTSSTPVLAVTAFADPDSMTKFHKAGFDKIITKPVSIRILLDALAALPPRPASPPLG